MEQNPKQIPVFFTIDDGYAPYLGVALQSIIANASKEYLYKIFIINKELSEINKGKLSAMSNENFDIQFVEMDDCLGSITDRKENRLRCDYFTLTIYFRLFIPDMFPQYDKGLYLDSDIVVPGDISQLYNLELGDNLVGAANDHSIVDVPELVKYIEQGIGIDRYEYINSGILLMNLKKMREKALSTRFLTLLNTYHFDCVAPDQDYLNAMCHGKIVYLDICWDAMPVKGKEPMETPKLIHYNLFDKPWCYDDVQYEAYFWQYAEKSVFYDEIVDYKNHYSEEQKQSDREHMSLLLHKGNSLPDSEVTFKKMYENGAEIRII